MTKPVFAAVGHPNKGKSSIVATLAQDDSVVIGTTPGVTAQRRYFPMKVDGEVLYVLVDTPGFQRARRALEWMKENETTADKRPDVVRKFLEVHSHGDQFFDECELLAPLMEEFAGILYVVDGSVPYGPEYEAEMEILRWTGQPRMALINPIGDADHIDSWRAALGQYFSLVRVFNAVKADFHKGVELLRAFGQLNDDWQSQLQKAVDLLVENRQQRHYQAAQSIANTMGDMLALKEEKTLSSTAVAEVEKPLLEKKYRQKIMQMERRSRKSVEDIYAHKKIERIEDDKDVFEDVDLFSEESLRVFGLSRLQLMGLGLVGGAGAGGVIDLAVGGTSFFIGTVIGGCVGAAGAYFSASKLIEAKILNMPLGRKKLVVGPARNINFPHIVFNRARLHHLLIANRTHAKQGDLVLNETLHGLLRGLTTKETKALEKAFKGLRKNGFNVKQREALVKVILDIFIVDCQEAS